MDLDIEMDDAVPQEEPIMMDIPTGDDILQLDDPEEAGEVIEDEQNADDNDESKIVVPYKVHIRGLDTLHTDDIRAYVKTYSAPCDRVEWIDDNTANIIFSSENLARDAIMALSSIEIADPSALALGETLPAKPMDGRPEINLQIRLAVLSDRKAAGAALRSRYYLLHPEHDPEERWRRHEQHDHGRNRYRDRDGRNGGRYHRRQSEDYRDGRDSRDVEHIPFEASMYDDAPRSARPRRHSEDDPKYDNRGKELFAGHRRGRDRSASPHRYEERDRDRERNGRSGRNGGAAMDREPSYRAVIRRSSGSKNRDRGRDSARDTKELFSTKKDLFQIKDITILGGGNLDTLERSIGSAQLREEDRPKIVEVPMFNIRGDATGSSATPKTTATTSARSNQQDGGGFSIRGSSANAKELFPGRLDEGRNSGKELIGSKKARQRAEDLFG